MQERLGVPVNYSDTSASSKPQVEETEGGDGVEVQGKTNHEDDTSQSSRSSVEKPRESQTNSTGDNVAPEGNTRASQGPPAVQTFLHVPPNVHQSNQEVSTVRPPGFSCRLSVRM